MLTKNARKSTVGQAYTDIRPRQQEEEAFADILKDLSLGDGRVLTDELVSILQSLDFDLEIF